MDSRCYLSIRSRPSLAIAVGMEQLEVVAPYSVWELGFSLFTLRELTYELKNMHYCKTTFKKWKPADIIPHAPHPSWLLWSMRWGGWGLQIMTGNWEAIFG